MNITTLTTGLLCTNTYIVSKGSRAFIVDPGDDFEKIEKTVQEQGLSVEAVLLTHGHFDHMNAAVFFQQKGISVLCHHLDADKLNSYKSLAFPLGIKLNKLTADITLSGGETLKIASMDIKVVHTPGHSKGGVCYIVEDNIFCGDTLFYLSYGRVDFYDGSFSELKNSILNKLFNLDGDYKVYPGHGQSTTLDFEREHNAINFD